MSIQLNKISNINCTCIVRLHSFTSMCVYNYGNIMYYVFIIKKRFSSEDVCHNMGTIMFPFNQDKLSKFVADKKSTTTVLLHLYSCISIN